MDHDPLRVVQRMLDFDLPRLLNAVDQAELALQEYEQGKRVTKATVPPSAPRRARMGDTPKPMSRQVKAVHPRYLRARWNDLQPELVRQLKADRSLILPGCRHLLSGNPGLRSGLATSVRQTLAERRKLADKVRAVRAEATRCQPVRQEFMTLCRLWDAHLEVQETILFPQALAEFTEEVSMIREGLDLAQGVDDIGSRLRSTAARRAATRDDTPPHAAEPVGVLGRLRALFDKPARA